MIEVLSKTGRTRMGLAQRSATLLILLMLGACAKDVGLVDRTQANRVSKSLFQGEWYFHPTVLETQYNQGILFEGLSGELERIKWDVQETRLIAYRAWTLTEGADINNGSSEFLGVPIAIFPIDSHFDVWRDYNPANGEQSNVLLENTTDRPWWEREYMRVDWSTSLLKNGMSLEGFVTAYADAPYYVQENEIDNPNRAEVTENNINIVQNFALRPDEGTCYALGTWSTEWCNGSRGKLKLSFRKVDPTNSYTALYYPDNVPARNVDTGKLVRRCNGDAVQDSADLTECKAITIPVFERFGFFRTKRFAYDKEYQWTRGGRVFLANRWNIWAKSRDASGNELPYKYRHPGSFTYYTNVDFPRDNAIWDATVQFVTEWDNAFKETVGLAKGELAVDFPMDGPSKAARAAQLAAMKPIFKISKNSCNEANVKSWVERENLEKTLSQYGFDVNHLAEGNMARVCSVVEHATAGRFTWEKFGDIRHSFVNWVDTPQQAGPLGYGPAATDPVTGEIISANANIYGASVDTLAAYAADVVALVNGDTTIDETITGEDIREHIRQSQKNRFGAASESAMHAQRQSIRDVAERFVLPMRGDERTNLRELSRPTDSIAAEGAKEARLKGRTASRSKLEKLAGSALDKELLNNDELRRALGIAVGDEETPLQKTLQGKGGAQSSHDLQMAIASRNITMAEWVDPGMAHLNKELKGKTWDEVYTYMRREIYRSVTAHEVGHTLGLRHNFEGSFDPLNYHPEFWDSYNTQTGKVERRTSDGEPTSAERYMYSTIMDYDARFYADSNEGIGAYDRAAIKFGYGGMVETFKKDVPALFYEDAMYLNNYHKLPKILSGEYSYTFSNDDTKVGGPGYNAYTSGGGTSIGAMQYIIDHATAKPQNIWARSHVSFEDLLTQENNQWTEIEREEARKRAGIDKPPVGYQPLVYVTPSVVPYKFCPDEWSFESNVTCQPYDKGGTFQEIVEDRMQRHDAYYFFNNFRRDRFSFNVGSIAARVRDRFFVPMSSVYRYYLYGFSSVGGGKTLNDFDVGKDWQNAAIDGLNYLTSVVEQPEPGKYCLDASKNMYMRNRGTCASGDQIDVPVGVGKYYYSTWNDEYDLDLTRVGTYIEKYMALWAITDNESAFYRTFSDMLDSGAFALSYWRGGLDKEMLSLFHGVYLGETAESSWRVQKTPSAGINFQPKPLVDIYGTGPALAPLPAIEASTSWSLRYQGIAMSLARFNSLYDYSLDFSNYAKICLDGSRDCLNYSRQVIGADGAITTVEGREGQDFTLFVDPTTGYRYTAPRLASDPMALGAHMLAKAQKLVTESYVPAERAWRDAKSRVETLTRSGSGASAASIASAREALDRSDLELQRVERLINDQTSLFDVLRDMASTMEFGG